ncbi:cupin domain-containing protein [Hyphomicrobium sp.]|uniref:cupin domain-containing protein n=1 Tax=Hyphomicrobium sp. TaxID=82 RepID=UPI002E36CCC4|nr:cupin domain-containing protein [Hyphomicrobium sp.]HEX2840031.1 cupin domain-containing protein [Hyphomicrobium sp.]
MSILSFGKKFNPQTTPIVTDLVGWTPYDGAPSMKTWIEHKSDDGKLLTGFWEAQPGTYRVVYTADEFIHVFEGRGTLFPDYGQPTTFEAGDSFQIPKGFTGLWKTEDRIRKVFVIRAS